jgi:undecaprenyl-diphosphatase
MMKLVTHLGGARATILPGLILLALGGYERSVGMAMLFANLISHLPVQLLKRLVARPRPADADGRPLALVALPDPFSFPSGHAAAATAVGVTTSLAYPWLAPLVLALAAAVPMSRVLLRVHHAADVVVGVALGFMGALVATHLLM